jgi:hypothetical protein
MTRKIDWAAMAAEVEELEDDDWEPPAPRATLKSDLADGGYLSWLYGSSELRHQAWPPKFLGPKPIVVMDSRTVLFRRQRSPHYKLNRETKRGENLRTQERTKLVHNFRELIEEEDGRFRFVRIEGLEADDLVALAAWRYGKPKRPVRLMGIDKDFLQVSNLIISDKDNEQVTFERFQHRMPLACQEPVISAPWQIPLTLALFGDKSDGVPRILAPRAPGLGFLTYLWSMTPELAYLEAYSEYGEAFMDNLYDVALPDPHILGLSPDECLEAFCTGFWGPKLWDHLWPAIQQEVDSWKLSPSKT